jgi:glyoxylase-like metal-dependent hydrolase (beta-lactamase superfamily II)
MTPEVPSALSPLIRRVVANNPSLMTGPGTNTYLVGIDEVAVIDPGPDVAKHVESIVGAAMRDRVRWVLLTHTHPDHWPAADRIRKKTGALVGAFGKFPKADEVKLDLDLELNDGDTIDGTEFRLEALHTPGHAPNHLCFLLDEERALFTGDHVLNGTTTVVNPQRGGDMTQYMASLERLRKLKRLARICPAHGDVIDDPAAVLSEYVAHRKMRERQILKVLKQQPRTIKRIVETLYTGTPDGLIEMAERQVHAHLLKLKAEGKVQGSGAKSAWKLAGQLP